MVLEIEITQRKLQKVQHQREMSTKNSEKFMIR